MRKVIYSFFIVGSLIFTGCKTEKKNEVNVDKTELNKDLASANFGVRGNCGMCKATIEKAATSIEGVTEAKWSKSKKNIELKFDAKKTDPKSIEKAIANSGYDTENMLGNLDAYKNLPECCKYDHEMKMNLTGDSKSKDIH